MKLLLNCCYTLVMIQLYSQICYILLYFFSVRLTQFCGYYILGLDQYYIKDFFGNILKCILI